MITLGLLSDSHGRAATTHAAVTMLIDHGADVLIHLGDIGTVEVLDTLAVPHPETGGQIESHAVFGNTDWDRRALGRYAEDLGIRMHEPAGVLEVDGCRIGITHGHDASAMRGLIESGVDYLVHGHTHVQADTTRGKTRVINPGALFRARRHTAALLRPGDGACEVLEVSGVFR